MSENHNLDGNDSWPDFRAPQSDGDNTVWARTPQPAPRPAPQPLSPYGPSPRPPYGAPQQGPQSASAFGMPSTGPQAEPRHGKKQRAGIGAGAVVGLVALAAVLGGGAGAGATLALNGGPNPSAVRTPTAAETTTQNAAGEQVTKVVQGDSSAPDWTVTADAVSASVVSIQVSTSRGSGQGSGVIFDKQGHVVTNNHVVSMAVGGAGKVQVVIGDAAYAATIVGTDPSTDLAVLKIDNPSSDLRPIAWANSDDVVVGQPVMAVGNPLGLSGTVTTGIISAVDRPVTTQAEGVQDSDTSSGVVVTNAIQTSAPINPGNSGGALVNANGELVGINSSIASLSSGGGQTGNIGIGFAIPSNQAKNIAEQLVQNGKAQHAFLGVSARDGQAEADGRTIMGAEITDVVSGSGADEGGLQPGDLILKIGDTLTPSSEAMVGKIRDSKVGDKIKLQVLRDGQTETVTVTLSAQ